MNLYHLQLGAVAVCCTVAGAALGGIETPPPWAGTGLVGNSTHWRWDFLQGQTPQVGVGNGAPNSAPPVVTGGTWAPFGVDGAWVIPGGGSLTIDLANFPQPNDFKLIWIQFHVIGLPGALVPPPVIQVDSGGVPAVPFGPPTLTPTPDGGYIGAQGFRFPFNPPFEVIQIFNPGPGPMAFEWIVIDTICAPAPGAGAALLLGSAAFMRRRR